MNARQAAKAAAKRIEELEQSNALYKKDVRRYYDCIEGTVDGKSICEWCEDIEECQLQDKMGKGCKEWSLKYIPVESDEGSDADEGQGLFPAGITGRE